jgi:D-specific alpha-keto acid dehydrogenase
MLMSLRNARSILRRVDAHDYRLHDVRGRELRDLTVGVVGTGRIGSAVIHRLRGFGCRIVAYDTQAKTSAEHVSLDELLEVSDILTLHTPLDESTHHLLDSGRIARMRPGAHVINTGRGGLVDTEALIEALEGGQLGGAALDVLENEEGIFYADHGEGAVESAALIRLQNLPNAIVTPHTAYFTDHALTDTVVNSLINCLRFEKGLRHG